MPGLKKPSSSAKLVRGKAARVKAVKARHRTAIKRIFFDIETEVFTDEFERARNSATRVIHAPKMRVACTFDGAEWRYFLPSGAGQLIALIQGADEIVTFNGKEFDELILRKHHGLTGSCPARGNHVDLCAIIFEKEGHGVSLHRLAQLNLGERKHTKGRSVENLNIDELKEACRSDVWQTYRLWELWCKGRLRIPEPRPSVGRDRDDMFDVGPGHHMPQLCPRCHTMNTLILIEYDTEQMSEGQLADYLAGVSGTALCDACEFEFDFGM
jgi:hypothetical protein